MHPSATIAAPFCVTRCGLSGCAVPAGWSWAFRAVFVNLRHAGFRRQAGGSLGLATRLTPLRGVCGVGLRSHQESFPRSPFRAQSFVPHLCSLAELRLCLGFRVRTHFLDHFWGPILGLCCKEAIGRLQKCDRFSGSILGPVSESLWLAGLKGLVLVSSCVRRLPVVFRLMGPRRLQRRGAAGPGTCSFAKHSVREF